MQHTCAVQLLLLILFSLYAIFVRRKSSKTEKGMELSRFSFSGWWHSSSEMVWKMDVSLTTELQRSLIKNKESVCLSRMPRCHFESRRIKFSLPTIVFKLFISLNFISTLEKLCLKLIFFFFSSIVRKHKFRINDDDDKNLEAEHFFFYISPSFRGNMKCCNLIKLILAYICEKKRFSHDGRTKERRHGTASETTCNISLVASSSNDDFASVTSFHGTRSKSYNRLLILNTLIQAIRYI